MYNTRTVRIDSISEIDLDTVSLSDICYLYGTGISTATGSKRKGTYKPGYRNGVMTNLGDIQKELWRHVVEHIARRDGEVWLVNALLDWEKRFNYGRHTHEDLLYDALALYSYRQFDNPQWCSFIPFNRKYRADALKQAHIATVVTSCCGRAGDVTQEQIDHAYQQKIYCPHCGRASTFFVVDAMHNPPWEES